MPELLTSLDVVNQSFKKSMRGYDASDVDEFLDRIAETLQVLNQRNKELEHLLKEKEDRLNEYDEMRNVLQDTLLLAQKSADDRVKSAREQANSIVQNAKAKADEIKHEAIEENSRLIACVKELRGIREMYAEEFRSLLAKYDSQLNLVLASRYSASVDEICEQDEEADEEEEAEALSGNSKEDIEAACGMLGIDPNMLINGKK